MNLSALSTSIKDANNKRALGLMIYTIPNFPDPETYEKTLSILNQNPYVSIIETTFPVTSKFSEYANVTIQNAHKQASEYVDGISFLDSFKPFQKPSIAVIYQETFNKVGFETILKRIQGKIDGILFEWDIPDFEKYFDLSKQYQVELILCVEPSMKEEEIDYYLSFTKEDPTVYLVSAPMTGGEIFAADKILTCVNNVKKYRPCAKIAAGFGIGNADDIKILSQVENLDAVIIGTQFLKVMNKGIDAVSSYLDEITDALLLR